MSEFEKVMDETFKNLTKVKPMTPHEALKSIFESQNLHLLDNGEVVDEHGEAVARVSNVHVTKDRVLTYDYLPLRRFKSVKVKVTIEA